MIYTTDGNVAPLRVKDFWFQITLAIVAVVGAIIYFV
jgi:hypothetical protein